MGGGLYPAAFALLQGIDIVANRFDWPQEAIRLVILAMIVGFFVTLVLAWYHGERGAQKVSGMELMILTFLLALGGGAVWRYSAAHRSPDKSVANSTSAPAEARPISAKSIAVLAFDNLSDDKKSEYFSDGVSEELLTVLQKIPGLRVAARTSAFSFKGRNVTAQEIGQKLGVAHLVEGSVRKAGDLVRIAARLTDTSTGDETWSENYTRNLKDVFAVQTELAETIVGQLRTQLTGNPEELKSKEVIQAQVQAAEQGGTKNVEAHQSYLQGRYQLERHSEQSTALALQAFQHAVDLDPGYALAWAGLGETNGWMCAFSGTLDRAGFEQHLAAARDAAARALSLAPDLPEGLVVQAGLQLSFDFDWKGAAATLHEAMALAPTNVTLVSDAGNLALANGDTDRATALYRQAVALDPVNPEARSYLAYQLATCGTFAEAQAEYARVAKLNPSAPWAHAELGIAYLLAGKFAEAVTEAQKETAEWAQLPVVAIARWAQKRVPDSDAALARLRAGYSDTAAYQIAEVYGYRGEKDQAFTWLERSFQQRDPGLQSVSTDKFLLPLHDDPRWPAFLRKMGMPGNK